MLLALQLLAENADGNPNAGASPFLTLGPLVIIFILFYIFMIRAPMKRQEQEKQNLFSALKKNDKVVTASGIIGIIASINEKQDEVTLKVDESSNVRLRVLKSSIQRILTPEDTSIKEKEGGAQG